MADHVNLSRLSRVAPPHAWRGKSKLKQAGFVFKGEKLLCGAPKAVGAFWAPGVCDEAFHAQLDGRDRVVERTWTPVTRPEHEGLRQAIEPRTGEPHLVFAWMPLPAQSEELAPPAAPSLSEKKVELLADEEIGQDEDTEQQVEDANEELDEETDKQADDEEEIAIDDTPPDQPKQEKKDSKKKSKAKKKQEPSTDDKETDE